jgi:hypothetical protein
VPPPLAVLPVPRLAPPDRCGLCVDHSSENSVSYIRLVIAIYRRPAPPSFKPSSPALPPSLPSFPRRRESSARRHAPPYPKHGVSIDNAPPCKRNVPGSPLSRGRRRKGREV